MSLSRITGRTDGRMIALSHGWMDGRWFHSLIDGGSAPSMDGWLLCAMSKLLGGLIPWTDASLHEAVLLQNVGREMDGAWDGTLSDDGKHSRRSAS